MRNKLVFALLLAVCLMLFSGYNNEPKTIYQSESVEVVCDGNITVISDLVADYEDIHYTIAKPTLVATIKLRMYEMGLTQTKVAAMLGISSPRLSEIMNGKAEPSLALARMISLKLNISPSIVLGV